MDDEVPPSKLLRADDGAESEVDEMQQLKHRKRGYATFSVSGFEPHPKRTKTAPTKYALSRIDSPKENYAVVIDESIVSATTDRRLFRTSKGFIGLGPRTIKKGDEVWVLYGGNVPFLLRPDKVRTVDEVGDRQCHSLVGDCYLHGIMHGGLLSRDGVAAKKVYLV